MRWGLLSHTATSPYQIETKELIYIADQLFGCHARLEELWREAFEARKCEHEAHEAELAAAKTRTAPGSQADAEHVAALWGVLTATADVVLAGVKEAMPERTRALLGEAQRPPADGRGEGLSDGNWRD